MDVKLPKLGEGADSGVVVNLFVKEGDTVAKDQAILELENEKAVASIPSTAAGVVAKIYVKPGDRIGVGQRIMTLTESGQAATAAPAAGRAGSPLPAAGAKGVTRPAETNEEEDEDENEEERISTGAPMAVAVGPQNGAGIGNRSTASSRQRIRRADCASAICGITFND